MAKKRNHTKHACWQCKRETETGERLTKFMGHMTCAKCMKEAVRGQR